MIGGQQVMFANNAQFAHQVGATAGTMPPNSGMGGMSAPSFGRSGYAGQDLYFTDKMTPGGYGASLVGGMGGAIPGMASGMALAGGLGLMGRAGTWMDPFTGVGRAFASGAGAGGMGLLGTMGHIGGAFSAGGLQGGLGAIGGGLSAAALPLAGYYAAGQAINFAGSAIYSGAQDISRMGAASQHFGPQFGVPGARPGGGMARGQIQGLVDALHEVVGEETMATMGSLQRMVEQAGRQGMLSGITNAEQFKQKFKAVVAQTKEVAKILGTSLEEAMPVIGQFQQMGLWRPQDVMGGALALKAAGPQAAPHMMASMQAGAARSHAMGGSLAAGAALGRQQFSNIQSAVQTGVLSNEMVMEMTGGVGGDEGQRLIADRMTEQLQYTTQTPVGRLTMSAMGEVKDGRYTGRIDQRKLEALTSGRLSVSDLQRMGQAHTRTREGAASFTFREGQIGQELMSKGGMEAQAAMYQAGLERAGFGGASEEIQGLMLQKMFGLQSRDAMMIQRLMKELPTITERRKQKDLAALKDAFQQAEERQNRSWEGFKDAVSRTIEVGAEDPMRHFASRLTSSFNERFDTLTDYIWGRKRDMDVSAGERFRMLSRSGGLGAATTTQQQSLMSSSAQMRATLETSWLEQYREGDRTARVAELGGRKTLGPAGEGDIDIGGGYSMKATDLSDSIKRAQHRTERGRSISTDFSGDQSTQDIAIIEQAYRKAVYNPRNAARLAKARKSMSAGQYARFLRQVIDEDPEASAAFRRLHNNRTDQKAEETESALTAISLAQAKAGTTSLEADFDKVAGGVSFANPARDPEELRKFIEEGTKNAYGALDETGNALAGRAAGAAVGGLLPMFGSVGALVGGEIGSRLAGSGGLEGISEKDFQTFMTTEAGEQLVRFVQETGGRGEASGAGYEQLRAAIDKGGVDGVAGKIFRRIGSLSPEGIQKFLSGAGNVLQGKQAKVVGQELTRRKEIAERELEGLSTEGMSEEGAKQYRQILEKYRTGDLTQAQEAERLAETLGDTLSEKDLAVLRKSEGGVARQLASRGAVSRLGGVGENRGQFMQRLKKEGLTEQLARLHEFMPDEYKKFEQFFSKDSAGGAALTGAELSTIKESLKGMTRGGLTDKPETEQEKLVANMTKFVGANEKFVLAVSSALDGKLSTVTIDDLRREMNLVVDRATEKK